MLANLPSLTLFPRRVRGTYRAENAHEPTCHPIHRTDLGKAANFPYATINPEGQCASNLICINPCGRWFVFCAEARIPVPDARFEWLCDLYKPASRVPAFLTILDIAGLTAVRFRLHPFKTPLATIAL